MLALAECRTPTERRIVTDWLAANHPDAHVVTLQSLGNSAVDDLPELARLLEVDDSLVVLPVRVAWLPPDRDGARRARVIDLLPGRDPYQPPERRQATIARSAPDRARVVTGASATVGELRRKWETLEARSDGEKARNQFADFVTRRAGLALERAKYTLLGPEYKSPQLVKEELLSSARFREGLEQAHGSRIDAGVLERTEAILDELVTGWGPLFVDIIPAMGRLMYRRGFDRDIDYDEEQIVLTRDALQNHSTITLMSHRSNLDAGILSIAMRENGLPPAHGFAGINMAFWPMGPIMRRAGVIFIRRDIGKDPLYRYALRAYVAYLVEKRFNLHWSIEGTRSRTGKMLPPKLGLLSYVADAYLEGRTDDVLLLPASISFDQLNEVGEYASYARGAEKKPEGMGWLLKFTRDQGGRHFGKVYVRYGAPVSMRHFLGPNDVPGSPRSAYDPEIRMALQKAAFEVAWRINQVTPVSATALMTSMLLAVDGRALTLAEMRHALDLALAFLREREVPLTGSAAALATDAGAVAALDALTGGGGPVTRFDGGEVPVWAIETQNQLSAAFYRNSIIHFFLERSICEIALHAAIEAEDDRERCFWDYVFELRDLLKFDFYFQERDDYRAAIALEMERTYPGWADALRGERDQARRVLLRMRPMTSPLMLRTFLEAYRIVGDVLVLHPELRDDSAIVECALGLGRQYQMQQEISSDEPVSLLLFQTALSLARNRGLLDETADTADARREFATTLGTVLAHVQGLYDMSEPGPTFGPAPIPEE
jgi:glycerol-3-phosphate O-acyltransferase